MIEHILLELFQNKLKCKKAVSKGWCKESSIATMYLTLDVRSANFMPI